MAIMNGMSDQNGSMLLINYDYHMACKYRKNDENSDKSALFKAKYLQRLVVRNNKK